MVKQIFFIFIFISFLISEVLVEVDVDRRKIIKGDSIELSVTVLNNKKDPIIRLPIMQDFKIVSGPNQSSSTNVQIVNGKMTKESSNKYTWILIPNRIGKLTIPSFKILTGNQSFNSSAINIDVTKREIHQSNKAPQFFIEAEVDNYKPYRGQQITLKYTLYTQLNVSSFEDELPKYIGFWTEELFSAKKLQFREIIKNGSKFYASTIKKIALFPTKSGKIIIEPLTAIIGIRETQPRWNDFSLFGPPSKKYTISTEKIELYVQQLPNRLNGDISALVGDWEISSFISSIDIVQDEAITYQIKISGTGNIQAVDLSEISFPKELEVFEPKIEFNTNPLRDKIGGDKIFEWVLIPRYSGEIIIPKFELNYFDPIKKIWRTILTDLYKIKVVPNLKSSISPIGLSKEEITLVGKDIRFIDESIPEWKNINSSFINGISLGMLIIIMLIFIFPYSNQYMKQTLEKVADDRKIKGALFTTIKIIKSDSNSPKEKYVKINEAFKSYINIKTKSNRVNYSRNEIISFVNMYTSPQKVKIIENILKEGEEILFSSTVSDSNNVIDKDKIIEIIKEIDANWS